MPIPPATRSPRWSTRRSWPARTSSPPTCARCSPLRSSTSCTWRCRRAMGRWGAGLLRQTREIIELVPSLHDDFSHEVLFTRAALGKPLVWTGTMPHNAEVIDRKLPRGLSVAGILEGRISPFELRETAFHQELAP